jgi:hypothetical protein
MKVEIPQPRATVTNDGSDLKIIIPIKRNWFITLFLTFWLGGWAFGEFTVSHAMFSGSSPLGPKFFMLFWLGGWTVGGGFAIYVWFRNLMGKEVISINSMTLTIRQEVGGIGRSKEYEMQAVKNLRVSPLSYNPWNFSSSMQIWGIGGGLIAFDYGAQTFRFGTGLAESEAQDLINVIKKRFNL